MIVNTFFKNFLKLFNIFVLTITKIYYIISIRKEVIILNERLKQIRKAVNKTQKEFGKILGVNRDAYASYETGRVIPSELFIKHLCDTFNVNEEWLKSGTGEMFKETKASILDEFGKANNLTDIEKALVEAYVELSPDERNAVVNYIKKAFNKISDTQTKQTEQTEQTKPPSREEMIISEIFNKDKIIAETQKIKK